MSRSFWRTSSAFASDGNAMTTRSDIEQAPLSLFGAMPPELPDGPSAEYRARPRASAPYALLSGAGALDHDFDAAVLRPTLLGGVWRERVRVAEPFGRNDLGVDALRHKVRDHVIGTFRRQIEVVCDAFALQRRSYRLVVGMAVHDDSDVLEGLQAG